MIDVDKILEQLPPGIYSLRDRVAQVLEILSKAAPVNTSDSQLNISRDARTSMLVASIPGVFDPLASKLDEAQRMFDDVDAAAADEMRRAVAPTIATFKAQGEPYALDAWPNEDEL